MSYRGVLGKPNSDKSCRLQCRIGGAENFLDFWLIWFGPLRRIRVPGVAWCLAPAQGCYMVKVTLRSLPMLNTPSFLAWASSGFKTTRRKAQKQNFIKMISEGYFLPEGVVIDLLREKIRWSREGSSVVFECPQARLWKPAEGSPHSFEVQSDWLPE